MWVNLLKSNIVLKVSFGIVKSLSLHVVLDSQTGKFFIVEKFVHLSLNSINRIRELLNQVFEQNSILAKRKIGKVLQLFGSGEKVKVVLESLCKFLRENWKS